MFYQRKSKQLPLASALEWRTASAWPLHTLTEWHFSSTVTYSNIVTYPHVEYLGSAIILKTFPSSVKMCQDDLAEMCKSNYLTFCVMGKNNRFLRDVKLSKLNPASVTTLLYSLYHIPVVIGFPSSTMCAVTVKL